MKQNLILLVVGSLAACLIAGCSQGYKPGPIGAADNPVHMAFVPSRDIQEIISAAKDLADMLKDETGLHFDILAPSDYGSVVTSMEMGRADVAWLSPFAYVLANETMDAQAILVSERAGQTKYSSILVVRKDSGITSVAQLKGKRVALVDRFSASGSLYPQMILKEAGLDPEKDVKLIYTGGHDKAVIAAYNKKADAAGCYKDAKGDARDRVAESTILDIKDKTTILANSDDIPNDNVTVSSRLPKDVVEKIRSGLLAISKTEKGKKALQELAQIDGFQTADDKNYDSLRQTAEKLGINIKQAVTGDEKQ